MSEDPPIDAQLRQLVDKQLEVLGSTYPSKMSPSRHWAIALGKSEPTDAERSLLNDSNSAAFRHHQMVLKKIKEPAPMSSPAPSSPSVVQKVPDLLQAFIDSGSEALVRLYHRLTPTAFESFAFGPSSIPLRESTHIRCTLIAANQTVSWKPAVVIEHPSLSFNVHAISPGDQAAVDGVVSVRGDLVTVDGARYHGDGKWRAYLLCQAEDPLAADNPVEVFALNGTGDVAPDQTDAERLIEQLIEQGYLAAARSDACKIMTWNDQRLAGTLWALYTHMGKTIPEVARDINITPPELAKALPSFAKSALNEIGTIKKYLNRIQKDQGEVS